MRRRFLPLCLLVALAGFAGGRPGSAAEQGGGAELVGRWMLVGKFAGDQECAVLDVKNVDGQLAVNVLDAWDLFREPKAYLERSADAVVVLVTYERGDMVFKGILPGDAAAGRISGVFHLGAFGAPLSQISPGRLERTEAAKIAQPGQGKPDQDRPGLGFVLAELQARQKAVPELQDKRYAALDLRIAVAAARDLRPDTATETRAWATQRLAEAARRAGTPDADAEARLKTLKATIVEENHPQDGPLVVEPFLGRRDAGEDRVVLMELFTGAECGACVAADVAFDALISAYKPTELIALQYHLHIPGPDPLANADSVARQESYGVRSAPSTFFNGEAIARGGGSMGEARRKYNLYRNVIDDRLRGKKKAMIDLDATRAGDEVRIEAAAEVLGGRRPDDPATAPRLRLALVEDAVGYGGGNGQVLHRQVVRAMPGGADGKALAGGRGRVAEVVRVGELRNALGQYLGGYPARPGSRGPFPRPLPTIDLQSLHVVAFVQADGGEVLHAVTVPVRDATPKPSDGAQGP